MRRRALLAQKIPGAVLEELLFFGQTEVHAFPPRLPGQTQATLSDDVALNFRRATRDGARDRGQIQTLDLPLEWGPFRAEFQLAVEPQHLHPGLGQALDHFTGEQFIGRRFWTRDLVLTLR